MGGQHDAAAVVWVSGGFRCVAEGRADKLQAGRQASRPGRQGQARPRPSTHLRQEKHVCHKVGGLPLVWRQPGPACGGTARRLCQDAARQAALAAAARQAVVLRARAKG